LGWIYGKTLRKRKGCTKETTEFRNWQEFYQ